MAELLHHLTCKNVVLEWSKECQTSFKELKKRLVTVLAYPNIDVDFVLETDASHQGLGAMLSQRQEDGKLHPIAYASRALSGAEKNNGITGLETRTTMGLPTLRLWQWYGLFLISTITCMVTV